MLFRALILSLVLSLCFAQDETEGVEGIVPKFTEDQQAAIESGGEQQEFQAEVNRLMEIIVNSLYKTRDIFLRELISNANDAIDKVRMKSLTDKEILGDNKEFEIKVQADKDAGTLTILDTGIGMSAKELAENLGTIAHSGTAAFLDEAMQAAAESGADQTNLIGQFGVGFYSAFLVADEVTVISKSNDDEQQIWVSTADGNYRITKDPRGDTLGRGTAIILKLKEDALSFLEEDLIESTIKRYSQFIQYPIYLYSERTETEEVPLDEDDEDAEPKDDDDLSVEDEDAEDDTPKTKTIERIVSFWKRLNENKPIWSRRPSQIEDEEYVSFYKALTTDNDDPLSYTHFKAEGEIEFDSILYIPSTAPQGMYDQYYNSKSSMKLYVRRVLVADEFEDIVPRYLNFVKGLVDSNDLPLNVNREDLQKSKVMKLISRKLTRKVLDMLKKMAREDEPDEDDEEEESEEVEINPDSKYSKFWGQFGKSIKLGLLEDQRNKKRLMDLLRFPTSKSSDTPISLAQYVNRMAPGQKHIYYISGGSIEEVEASPFMERLNARGWEVLYFVDNLDEYLNLQDYDDFQFQAINKDGAELDGQQMQDFLKEKEDEFEDLKTYLKETFGSRISKVVISSSLTDSPMAVGTAKYGYSAYMEKLTKSQAFGAGGGIKATKILQLNYRHPVVIDLKNRIEDGEGEDNQELEDYCTLLLNAALIKSGFELDQEFQQPFMDIVDRVVRGGLKVSLDAELEPAPEFMNDVDDDEDEDEDDDEEEEEEDEEELSDDDEEEDKTEL